MRKIALLAFGVAVATSASGLTAHSYVQKGLKASYDGIDNAGTGTHDATVRTWKDITGNGYDGTLASTVSWESNCWVTTASDRQVKLPNNFSYITATRTFTVDCAISPSRGEKNNAASSQMMLKMFEGIPEDDIEATIRTIVRMEDNLQ